MPDRILVVDDEEPIREIVASMLGTAGYSCKQAGSGMEALAILTSGDEFELMLSDLMMADLDGIGLLERTKEKYPDMPVVMVTAVHDISVALAAIRNGAYDYLLKPFEREQLLNTVSRALENRRLKVENRTYQTNLESLVKARTDQLQATVRELERSYDITLEVLGEALDYKDRETEGHSRRVTAFTIAIAKNMGIPREQIETIARGAFLHDIGKMAIPDSILNKPGKLNPDEVTTMREHCYLGYKLVQEDSCFERSGRHCVFAPGEIRRDRLSPWLAADEIPLGARIFSVADTLDAITSDRPYRPKQTMSAARAEIQRCCGSQFDPEVVAAFQQMPDDVFEELRRAIAAQTDPLAYSAGAKD